MQLPAQGMHITCLTAPTIYPLSHIMLLQRVHYQSGAQQKPITIFLFVITFSRSCGSRWRTRSSPSAAPRAV
jgi:hypothetical protein